MRTSVLLSFILAIHRQASSLSDSPAQKLRDIIRNRDSGSALILPGVYDGISARIFSHSGAKVLFLSGFCVTASMLGKPDMGLLTQTEMESTVRCVQQAFEGTVSCPPIIVDGDTGYGGASNIRRTIRSLASYGAAAISIEDQMFPKQCTYAAGSGVRVVPRRDCLLRIKAALEARDEAKALDGNDVMIVARTDCRAALGFEEAKARCLEFESLGADIVYAENLQSKEEYMELRKSLKPQTITILAQVQTTDIHQKLYSAEEIGEMGYSLSLFGVTSLQAQVKALNCVAQQMFSPTELSGIVENRLLTSFTDLKETVGFAESESFQAKFL